MSTAESSKMWKQERFRDDFFKIENLTEKWRFVGIIPEGKFRKFERSRSVAEGELDCK